MKDKAEEVFEKFAAYNWLSKGERLKLQERTIDRLLNEKSQLQVAANSADTVRKENALLNKRLADIGSIKRMTKLKYTGLGAGIGAGGLLLVARSLGRRQQAQQLPQIETNYNQGI